MRRAVLTTLLTCTGAAAAVCSADVSTRQLVERTAAAHGLPPFILTALVFHESGFCAQALSPAGAIGYGQLMPATARGLGVNPYVPRENIWGAAKYLRQQWNTFANWPLALAAYNAGPGAVRQFGRVPPYAETQAYVRKVLATYAALASQHRTVTQRVQVPFRPGLQRPVISPAQSSPRAVITTPLPRTPVVSAATPATRETAPVGPHAAPREDQSRSSLLVYRAASAR
ncbi:lytic transglycosylase domain-containing protein [Deinococcus multiflagellatus]|uniref:Lytic transglycosylase domain-containing protein n=1 Tax=Deinococcus multiflagellatus TaxID=1656887 RepID=A0ABW1ZPU9_9DEIO|nr:lytic transglycosylase domain-containing protein [Deinococcus multiflagellatus]MBZ9714974.1 lytic transglycosylase domain-containing protein [Deinococcus multiflagellatus]